ncbi:MAG TPA: PEP-CTERM sorting domain-containing protein [Vicinamibacterales bacterium]
MRAPRWVSSTALVLLLGIPAAASAAPITIGQIDTFEDGTTQGWQINLLGMGTPPLPVPANVPTGGPAGSGDNFLGMVSTGIPMTAGNRMTVLNAAQWAGDYLAGGVTAISMDVANFGPTDVNLRLLFEDAMGGPPSNVAVSTNSILLPAFSGFGGWTNVIFPIHPGALTALNGSVTGALSNTTILRIFDSAALTFPGSPSIAAVGFDNITAVPEPATLLLLGTGVAFALRRRR